MAIDGYQVVWCCTEVEIDGVMLVEMLPEVAGRLHLGGVFNREPWEESLRLPTPLRRRDLGWGCRGYCYHAFPGRSGCDGAESWVSGT
jgi:hypothetical protein